MVFTLHSRVGNAFRTTDSTIQTNDIYLSNHIVAAWSPSTRHHTERIPNGLGYTRSNRGSSMSMTTVDQRRPLVWSLIVGIGGIVALVTIGLLVSATGADRLWWTGHNWSTRALVSGVLVVTGLVAGYLWHRGLLFALAMTILVILATLAWSGIVPAATIDIINLVVITVIIGLPVAISLGGIEHWVRQPSTVRWLPTPSDGAAVYVGIAHLLLVDVMKATLERRPVIPRIDSIAPSWTDHPTTLHLLFPPSSA